MARGAIAGRLMGMIPYCGPAPVPAEWLLRWNVDPVLIAAFLLAALLGWRRASDRAAFGTAMALLILLFLSPLCALTSALFVARIVHHVLMVGVIAPLIARAFDWRAGGAIAATLVSLTIFYAWHVPAVYAAALSNDMAYWVLEIALLASAIVFWAAVRGASALTAVAMLLVTMVGMGLLGALLTLAPTPFYAAHYLTTSAWGLTPLEDQQIAGLIMWAPAAGLYLFAALGIGWRLMAPARLAR